MRKHILLLVAAITVLSLSAQTSEVITLSDDISLIKLSDLWK